jgi:RsiW-degrading membrane proteinase PrsW (M82 family)
MWQQMIGFFTSAFVFPGLTFPQLLIAIGLGIAMGAVWLVWYRPPLRERSALWLVALVSAIVTWTAIAFVQIPLQTWTGQALLHSWDQETLQRWLLLAGIPAILLSGLVQEAAKLLPVAVYWVRSNRTWSPKLGLLVGAVSGAGFGIFEAVWVHNTILSSGWTWATVDANGWTALLGFIERFFAVGLHIGASALAGYGLARRLGWQFYLIAAGLHGLANYGVVLLQKGVLDTIQLEVYVAVIAVAIAVVALWLRGRPESAEN